MKALITTKRQHLLTGVLVGTVLAVLAWITGTALGQL